MTATQNQTVLVCRTKLSSFNHGIITERRAIFAKAYGIKVRCLGYVRTPSPNNPKKRENK